VAIHKPIQLSTILINIAIQYSTQNWLEAAAVHHNSRQT
jgi:hypothetical protein